MIHFVESKLTQPRHHWARQHLPFKNKELNEYWFCYSDSSKKYYTQRGFGRMIYLSIDYSRKNVGEVHNEHFPAIIQWRNANQPRVVYKWYQHDILHRLDGPAYHTKDYSIQRFFLGGKEIHDEKIYWIMSQSWIFQ